ncbi:type III-A CRISPR-associated RAMP protein Csm3 [Planktothrix mougeotii]|uniref:CRISPR system Cms endoribonuclease Csm3 n=1 Tax=Planktothrix mougeotii LEGE 06226 TaxID=1828728 RepID=A0ABR9U676_9CYAN|nr:type III-A CRISPR-associated RAMP protein Csm3 [Planktothrix mougeotii]MBE9141970.1 type III-A CRISPR-associated RAMP protein Csm3 [Planktothrix mougeotii LEGE 06226]
MTTSTTNKPQKQLLGKLYIKSILLVETGLHIGGGGETLNIGGLDKPVIRDPITQHPYLPGSSIKGKLRAILERLLNKPLNRFGGSGTYRYESDDLADGVTEIDKQYIKFQGAKTCEVSRVFGSTGVKCWIETEVARQEGLLDNKSEKKQIDGKEYVKVTGRNAPARLIVRDCHLIDESVQKLKKIDTGLYMTEWKFENGLDRITASANPRQVERVPKGSKFNFEMVYTVEDADQARVDLRNILRTIFVLEDDALGGHGSRGYGKIKFENLEFSYRDYEGISEAGSSELSLPSSNKLSGIEDTSQLPDKFEDIQKLLPNSQEK